MNQLAGESISDATLRDALAAPPPTSSKLMDTIDRLSSGGATAGVGGAPRYDDLKPWIESSDDGETETLDGYGLLECVGRGGMGVVFRATDPLRGDTVALKAMLPGLARDERARERFLREARAMAAVRHPNVVALHAVSEVDGLPYLIMEHVKGASLEDRLQRGAPMPADEIARIGAAVASGMAACHEKGVIHRDIKPSNVLLCAADGAVKITDFGLAAVASTPTLTHHGYLSGTPDYVAPERLTIGAEADERSDLFSLGCLLYTMATGEAPFGGDTPLITLHRIASQEPPLVRVKNPSVPTHLESAIASLMAKQPQDRPASASAAQALLLEDPSRARLHPPKAYRWVVAVVVLSVALLATIFAVSRPDHEPPIAKIVVSTAAELVHAVEMIPDGGLIEIDTDEVLSVEPLYISFKSVTIAAAEGRAPTIRLRRSQTGPAPEYLLRAYYGALSLMGLQLEDTWDPEEQLKQVGGHQAVAEQYSLLSLIDADLYAVGCRFKTRTKGASVKLDPGNEPVLRDCELLAPSGIAISWHAIEDDGILLQNCVLAGNVALFTVLEGNAEMVWERSVVLANTAALELDPVRGQLTARVSDSTLQSAKALVLTSLNPPSLSQFKRTVAWIGSGNQVRGKRVYFSNGDYSPSWAREVTAWAIGDQNSTYGRELFRHPHQEVVARLIGGESADALTLDRGAR